MNRQCGIIASIWLYGIAAVAVLGGLAYVVYQIDSKGYQRGKLEIQAQWAAANQKAQSAADQERIARAKLASEQSAKLATAEGRARTYDLRWRQARAEAARAKVPLVVAAPGGVAEGLPGGAGLRMVTTFRVTPQFLREWDAAWLDQAGESFWPNPGGTAAEASPANTVDIEAVLSNHGENASRCSEDRRRYGNLIDLLETLRAR